MTELRKSVVGEDAGSLKSHASRSIERQAAKCIEASTRVKNIVRVWVQENRGAVGSLEILVRPLNDGGTMELQFRGNNLTEARKEVIRTYLQSDFKESIKPVVKSKLGWSNFRVSTCSRDKSELRYTWCIQKRDPLKTS